MSFKRQLFCWQCQLTDSLVRGGRRNFAGWGEANRPQKVLPLPHLGHPQLCFEVAYNGFGHPVFQHQRPTPTKFNPAVANSVAAV